MIRVAICDDHTAIREGFGAIIEKFDEFVVTAEASDGKAALQIARDAECDVMLLDINMRGESGIDVLRVIKQDRPQFPILILSGLSARQYALNALELGAHGYLEKDCDPEEIAKAMRMAASGRRYIGLDVGDLVAEGLCRTDTAAIHTKLSHREFQVFLRLSKGEAITHMANQLSLSVKTVSTYRTRILEKMGMQSNCDLTYYAVKNGLLE